MKSKSLYILSQNKAKTPICQVCRNIDTTGILCFKVEDDKLQLSRIFGWGAQLPRLGPSPV